MKKIVLLFLAVSLTLSSIGQETSSSSIEKNVLKVNTLSLFLGTGSIFYERNLTDVLSAQLGVGYLNFGVQDLRFTGLFLTPEVRIYAKKNAIDGFYIAPYLRYMKLSGEDKTAAVEGSINSLGGGLALGRQWITKSGFTVDLFFGGHYTDATLSGVSGEQSLNIKWFDGFRTRMGCALGFAF